MKISDREIVIVGNATVLFLVMVFLSNTIGILPHSAYAQTNTTAPSQNATTTPITTSVPDFKTLRDQYLAQWQQLNFQSVFDTYIEPYSAQGYGIYQDRPSNIFSPDTSAITLYVEPVGYSFEEGVDEKGNILYSFNFTATITISESQGNPLTEPIPAEFDEPLNSHNKATEAFMPITLTLEQPLPVGEYTITYDITDGTSGKSFQIVKDIRVAEVIS
jgi:hypothetical protein